MYKKEQKELLEFSTIAPLLLYSPSLSLVYNYYNISQSVFLEGGGEMKNQTFLSPIDLKS